MVSVQSATPLIEVFGELEINAYVIYKTAMQAPQRLCTGFVA